MKTAIRIFFTMATALVAVGLSQAAPSSLGLKPKTVNVESCSWNNPGHNPFMGEISSSIDRYQDIPADVRATLRDRMAKRQFDDWVIIRRDSIAGEHSYKSEISNMHFGQNSVCRTVNRSKWKDDHQERGLVYCESGHCILVPTVCRNVSQITREEPRKAAGLPVSEAPLEFEPPAAGIIPGGEPAAFAPTDATQALAFAPSAGGGGPLIPSFSAINAPFPVPIVMASRGPGAGSEGLQGGPQSPQTPSNSGNGPVSGGGVTPGAGFNNSPPPVVQVTPIPEPSTWMLALGGLAAVVFVSRRRKML
jgi:hypothetical protein